MKKYHKVRILTDATYENTEQELGFNTMYMRIQVGPVTIQGILTHDKSADYDPSPTPVINLKQSLVETLLGDHV